MKKHSFGFSPALHCNSRHWTLFAALVLLAMGLNQAQAQLGGGSLTTLWVGPDAQCDYATLQQAIDEISCGPVAPCSRRIRLSRFYQHVGGTVVLDKSIDFSGGWSSCRGTANTSVRTELSLNSGQGGPLFDIQPGSSALSSQFSELTLVGREFFPTTSGGVILMRPGPATLILNNSTVQFGNASFGGGIALQGDGSELRIIDSVIENGTAVVGGGIHCGGGGRINFLSGEIRNNTAEIAGGGLSLESGCELVGSVAGRNRYILNNRVSDMQHGQGGGIFATGRSEITMGAINSRTVIQGNEVDWAQGLGASVRHQYDEPGQNRGGGVHLSFADATFYNTWFRENRAADGGAISIVGDSELLVDRYPGSCSSGAPIKPWECSLFDFNDARGGRDEEGDEGGDGAVLYAADLFGQSPDVTINRSTIRFNEASCPGSSADGAPGECDIDDQGVFVDSTTSIFSAVGLASLTFGGNLIHGNDIGDDEDSFVSNITKWGSYFDLDNLAVGQWTDNTMTRNNHADFVVTASANISHEWANNIVIESEVDEFGGFVGSATCNLSNFASELQLDSASTPIANRNLDPFFADPDNSDPFQSDFRISSPNSPAVDRCDDAGGLAALGYDIVGNPRPLNIPAITNGPGQRDVGAFELEPPGYVNDTVDLQIEVSSAAPKQTELSQSHSFAINVRDVGANEPGEVTITLNLADGARLTSLSSPSGELTGPYWDCDAPSRTCTGPGAGADTITARVAHDLPGLAVVQATVTSAMGGENELTPGNNTAADTVLIGPGADLIVEAVATSMPLTQQQQVQIVVRNFGPDPVATGDLAVELTFTAASGDSQPTELSASGSAWDCNPAGTVCTFEDELLANEETPTLDLLLRYDSFGEKMVSATVLTVADFTDPNSANNDATATLSIPNPSEEIFSDGFEPIL